jgi:hypothetical protein
MKSFKHFLYLLFSFCICIHSVVALAQSETASLVPDSAFFFGLGVNANSTQFQGQQVQAIGISTVTPPGSVGSAGGPPLGVTMSPARSVTPAIQMGYFQKFQNSDYLWGVKLAYTYMGGATSTTSPISIPQYGTYPRGTPFTGYAVASSYQKTIQNQFSLIPNFGHAFERGTIYFGIGPTVSQSITKINDLVGYADIGRNPQTDVSGAPQSFSSSQWVYGGAAMIGGTYFIDRQWFLDFNYELNMTQNKTSNYFSTFNNPGRPLSYSGSLIGSSWGTSTTQSLSLTLNRAF